MKRNLFIIALIISVLALIVVSCKKKKTVEEQEEPTVNTYSPVPGAGGTLPAGLIPDSLYGPISQYFTVYEGPNPTDFNHQLIECVSRPHILMRSTNPADTVSVFNDRYIAFQRRDNVIDFFGQQWDDSIKVNGHWGGYYKEEFRNLYVLGTGENFSCYYITEGRPNGKYAKFSTIFSGKWNPSYGGLKDFQVAVVLLETSGNTHLAPKGSYRVLGDGNHLAQDTAWIPGTKRTFGNDAVVTDEDAFRMFRVR